jgi:RNA-directed DNA polymerase
VWILDADLAGAFDKISHEYLLEAIGGFPARGVPLFLSYDLSLFPA